MSVTRVAAGAVLLSLLCVGGARAQAGASAGIVRSSATAPPHASGAQGPVETMKLTLDAAVRRARDNNPDLAVGRLEPEASAARTEQASSAFVPVLSTTFGGSSTETPPSNFFLGAEGVESSDVFGSAAVRQRLPIGGGTWHVYWDASRTGSDSPITSFDPGLNSSLLFAFSQPLLRDREIDAARQQVIVAKSNQEISDLQFREAVVQTVAVVKGAYWDLKAALANVAVQERSLELAQELARQNRARVDVGQLPPLDLVAAEAEIAQRREQLIRARTLARNVEDRLRRLIMAPSDADFWGVRLEPTDEPLAGAPAPDVQAAMAAALDGRLDIQRARKDVETAATYVRFYGNQRLPDLRLEASYRPVGLGGTRLIRQGFPGEVVGRESTSFASTLGQVLTGDYPSWSLGVTVSYPLGRSYEEAGLARATIERRQAEARVASLESRAIEDVRVAARQIESTSELVEATRAGAELAQQRLDAEQKRFEVGMSTSFLVTQAQRDLIEAQVSLLRAMLDFQSALIDFEALQQAPAFTDATTFGLSGATVVALPPSAPRGISASGAGSVF